jgi:peptide/nickel transport system substrate-binding protein
MGFRKRLLALAAGSSLVAAATPALAGDGGKLVISDAQFLWDCNFNPYNPQENFLSVGVLYETLMFVNTLQDAKVTPWLATDSAWSDGNKTLTFTIRKGVKWSDGQPFTARDVVFTFNLLKTFPGLDLNSVWSALASVAQKGDDQVVLTFKAPSVPYFYYVADQLGIVPEHVWSSIKDPVAYKDTSPVGTGPYTIGACSQQNIAYKARSDYWQAGLPKIAEIDYPAFTTNPPANAILSTGEAQWGGQFIPNLKAEYLSKDKDNHYWFPPVTNVAIFINLKDPVLKDVALRKALAYAINRQRVATIGEYGYEPAANQAGVVTPTFSSWLDQAQLKKAGYRYDPKMANEILDKAGYKRGPDGMRTTPDGKPLELSIVNQSAYTDWVAALEVVSKDLKAVGIKLNVQNLAGNDYTAKLYNGDYQLGYAYESGGPTPYYEFRQWLYSAGSAPIGKSASTNWERYENKDTDALIEQYAQTTDAAEQHAILAKLQKVLLDEVPLIPVTEQVDWDEYSTKEFVGWPTPKDPYAQPFGGYSIPDWEVVVLHLQKK